MGEQVDRHGVRRELANGAQLVEVLSRAEYESEHLPGALSIPLPDLGREAPARLDRRRPVIVYCWDEL